VFEAGARDAVGGGTCLGDNEIAVAEILADCLRELLAQDKMMTVGCLRPKGSLGLGGLDGVDFAVLENLVISK